MKPKIEFTQEQIDEMINLHDNGLLNREIAEKFNVSVSTINRRLANKVVSRHPSLSKEREAKAIELYNKYHSMKKVSQYLHMGTQTIHEILIANNVYILDKSECKRKNVINKHYFDEIDSHRKAYYLGLLFADGTISGRNNRLQISLQEKDKDIIFQFREDLESDYKISKLEYSKKNPNWQDQYCLTISNREIHNALINHGMLPNKSLILEFPVDLDEKYYCSFILGYLDGDGSIHKKEERISLVSTENFCNRIASIVKDKFGIHCSIYFCHGKKDKTTRTLQIAGRNQVKTFLDWLYSKCDIFLERKHQIYIAKYCVS